MPPTRTFERLWAACCAGALRTRACCAQFGSMPLAGNDTQSRRGFLKAGGALIVSFSAGALAAPQLRAQGPFDTHPSHIDPKKLDSWLAVNADGTITAHTGKCDFGQGIFTAQTQLVAEELCVPLSRVH